MMLKCFCTAALLCLCACTSPPKRSQSPSQEYCGRHLIYRICAVDIVDDGKVDAIYFEGSREVFLFRPDRKQQAKRKLAFHACAQAMDKPLMTASNRLLAINEQTDFITRNKIKNDLLSHYLRYMPRVNKCNNKNKPPPETTEDDFHDFQYDDYND